MAVSAAAPTVAATPTVELEPTPTDTPARENITQPPAESKGYLEQVLDSQQLGSLSISNFLQYAVRRAVAAGVPANTLVLVLLFPLVAMLIAAARHFIGLRGFGIFTPAVVSVAFLATGFKLGMALFLGILLIAMIGRTIIRKLRLQYLPQMALLVWIMSIGVLGMFVMVPEIKFLGNLGGFREFTGVEKVGIFPILLLVLLTETFISAQISHGVKQAATLTVETLILATVSYLLMNISLTQVWVITHPELAVSVPLAVNILLGRFTGLRMLEYWRFRELLRK